MNRRAGLLTAGAQLAAALHQGPWRERHLAQPFTSAVTDLSGQQEQSGATERWKRSGSASWNPVWCRVWLSTKLQDALMRKSNSNARVRPKKHVLGGPPVRHGAGSRCVPLPSKPSILAVLATNNYLMRCHIIQIKTRILLLGMWVVSAPASFGGACCWGRRRHTASCRPLAVVPLLAHAPHSQRSTLITSQTPTCSSRRAR